MSEIKPFLVDFRVRPPYGSFLDLWIYSEPRGPLSERAVEPAPARSYIEGSIDLFMEEMDEAGIALGVIMGRYDPRGSTSNDDVATLVRDYPGRFVGFGSVGPVPIRDAAREARRCIEDLGLAGLNFDPGIYAPALHADAAQLYPLYALCQELGVPVTITVSVMIGPDVSYSHPAALDRVARDFPELTVIVAHAAWPWALEMVAVAFKRKNIYLLPDIYMHPPGTAGAEHYVAAANDFLQDRTLFGSAFPVRSLLSSRTDFEALGLRPEVRDNALTHTPRRLLGL